MVAHYAALYTQLHQAAALRVNYGKPVQCHNSWSLALAIVMEAKFMKINYSIPNVSMMWHIQLSHKIECSAKLLDMSNRTPSVVHVIVEWKSEVDY